MTDEGIHGHLTFIPYNFHVVHNAVRKGLAEFGHEAQELVIDLFYYFTASPG